MIISHPGCKDCKAGHRKCSFFVVKSLHRECTPFQAAQKEHCPHRNHATHLRRDHAHFFLILFFFTLLTILISNLHLHLHCTTHTYAI